MRLFFALCIIIESVLCVAGLPKEVLRKKEDLELLFKLAKEPQYQAVIKKHINSNDDRLYSLKIPVAPFAVDGCKELRLSPEIVRVMKFFREIRVEGKGMQKSIKVSFEKPGKLIKVKYLERKPHYMRLKTKQLPPYPVSGKNCKLIFTGEGYISSLSLGAHHIAGISPVFDSRAWEVLGGDRPVKPVKVDVYPQIKRSINGITELELNKFRRIYGHIDGPPAAWKTFNYYHKKGFMPGRGMVKLREKLEKGYGPPSDPRMKENPKRKGWTDYSFFEEYGRPDKELIKRINKYYPKDFEYALCLDNWPTWMDLENKKYPNPRGTPALKYFDSAADLAAEFIAAEKSRSGRLPKYLEVKNESTILPEWTYHYDPECDSWKLLADFHNKVADRVKKSFPDMKVGGPTSAWMMLDFKDFEQAKQQLRFMDQTAGHLDFYSHHFYESKSLIVNDDRSGSNHQGFLAGRLDAALDLIRSHMVITGNIKPMVISETGTLYEGGTDVDQWITLKNYSSYMMRYMNRANEFDLVVPFLLPVMWWRKDAESNIFVYDKNNKLHLTKQRYYLDFWNDYKGRLVYCNTAAERVFIHAVLDGKTLMVAINNMNPYRISVDLGVYCKKDKISAISQRRLYLENGKLIFSELPLKNLTKIPVAVEETTIIKISYDKPPVQFETITEKVLYADKVLQKTGKSVDLKIAVPDKDKLYAAKLRICLGRENGFYGDLKVNFNGNEYNVSLEDTKLAGYYWVYKELNIPVKSVKKENSLSVFTPIKGGRISSVVMVAQYLNENK